MITRNFSLAEFACKCGCGLANPHPALVMGLQAIRDALRVPLTISSGSRCHKHNRDVGGAHLSFHIPHESFDNYTMAADIQADIDLLGLFVAAEDVPWFETGGIAAYVRGYTSWLHVDVRGITGRLQPWTAGYIDGVKHEIDVAMDMDKVRRQAQQRGRA